MANDRFLIVDDDPAQARVLTRTLRMRGFDVTSVREPETALTEASSIVPDYAVIEQEFAGRSGLALIRPLRGINPDVKILVLTGHGSVERAVDSIKLGACNYMVKPACPEEVMAGLGIAAAGSVVAPREVRAVTRTYSLDEFEWKSILRALNDHDGNVSAAARALKMHRRTLQRKLEGHQAKSGKDIVAEMRVNGPRRRRIEMRKAHA